MIETLKKLIYRVLDDDELVIDENTVLLKDLGVDSFVGLELIGDV